jgi:hypothetical protein
MSRIGNNPEGIGGYLPGQSGNPNGRPKSQSRVQLWFLKHALEAGGIIVDIARNGQGTKAEALKLQACREILDRGIGKASQSVDLAVDLSVNKRLDEMTVEELQEFRAKYVAVTTGAPAMIEHILAEDGANDQQLELVGGGNEGPDGDT